MRRVLRHIVSNVHASVGRDAFNLGFHHGLNANSSVHPSKITSSLLTIMTPQGQMNDTEKTHIFCVYLHDPDMTPEPLFETFPVDVFAPKQ